MALKVWHCQGQDELVELCFKLLIPYFSLHLLSLSHIELRVIEEVFHVLY